MAEKQPYPPSNDELYQQGQAAAPGHGAPPPPYQDQPPAYEAPPPSFPYQAPPQQHQTAGVHNTTVIVQQVPAKPVTRPAQQPKKSKGFFGSLMKEVDNVVNTITHEVNDLVGQNMTGTILELFQTGNVIQLVSRTSGKSLQVVQSASGQLVVDGAGLTEGQPPFNTVWTVVAEGKNQVRLQNNNNFLTIINGQTTLITMAPGSVHGIETKFQLHLMSGPYVIIESMKEQGKHIGILPDGKLKPALGSGRDMNSQFTVKLIHSPYATAAPPPSK